MRTKNLLLLSAVALFFSVGTVSAQGKYAGKPFEDVMYKGGPQEIPGRLFCAYYDFGGEGVAYHDTDKANNGSGALNPLNGSYLHAFRIAESVDVSYTKGGDMDITPYNVVDPPLNVLYVGWTAPGEWLKYTVNVKKAGKYSINIMYTSNKGGKISLSSDDKDISGPVSITSTFHKDEPEGYRQWHHWNVMKGVAEVELKEGIQVLTLHTVEEGQMNYMWLDFVLK